jgi:predicted nucleic acid-binding protein
MHAEAPRLLEVTTEVQLTAEIYVRRKLMPARPIADALHLALASHHGCEVVATWNFRHLANAHKFDRIWRLNTQLGLRVPTLAIPFQLLGEADDE